MSTSTQHPKANIEEHNSTPWFYITTGVLLFVFLVWQAAVWTERYELQQLYKQANNDLTLNIASLRGKLDKYEYLPELLATRAELEQFLQEITPESGLKLNSLLKSYQTISNVSDIYLLNTEGDTVAASNWQSPRSFIGKNFSFRPYFQDAIKGQKGRFYGLGTTSGERGYYYSYPVFNGAAVQGVLVVKILIDDLEIPWQDQNSEFMVTDPNSIIFITSNSEWLLKSLLPIPKEALFAIQNTRRYADEAHPALSYHIEEEVSDEALLVSITSEVGKQPLRATRYLQVSLPMPDAGWRLHILKNVRSVRTEILKNSLLTAGIYLVVVLLSMYSIQRQRIQRERLRHDRETKKTLEANEARIRSILDNTKAGIVTMDSFGRIDYINPSAELLFGYPLPELQGQHFTELMPPEQRSLCNQALHKASALPIEISGLRKNQRLVPIEMVISVMNADPKGYHYMATLHDITERKQHEQALQHAYDELEHRVIERTQDLTQANTLLKQEIDQHRHTTETLQKTQNELIQAAKLALLGQMSASINHELNQPLAAIRAYAENGVTFLQRQNPEMAQANLEEIVELTERMASISAQLKMFARKSEGQLSLVSVAATAHYALRLFQPQLAKESVQLNRVQPEQELFVYADPVRLEQVLVNLISNALHAIAGQTAPMIELKIEAIDNEVCLSVSDSGAGIADEHLGQLFNPFFTTREGGKGLGLGLSISYRIIQDFGGTITAFNRPEGGATLQIRLPLAQPIIAP